MVTFGSSFRDKVIFVIHSILPSINNHCVFDYCNLYKLLEGLLKYDTF